MVQQTVTAAAFRCTVCVCSDAINFACVCVGSCTSICWGARGREKSATGGGWTAVSHAGGKLEFSPLSIYTSVVITVICFVISKSIYWPVECDIFLRLLCTVSGLESFYHQRFKARFKLSWQKQVSVRFCQIFLPKHNKCSNIIDKSTPSLFLAEQTQTGHCLLSFQPGLM